MSFAVSGKDLLGADGPAPGFSGVDYPLAPRALWLQINLVFCTRPTGPALSQPS